MDVKGSVAKFFSDVSSKLQDQTWYQQIKSKWEELDPQSRTYLTFAGIGIVALGALGGVLLSVLSVQSLKSELTEKHDLLNAIQGANDEMRKLRESVPSVAQGGDEGGDWKTYFETKGGTAGVSKDILTVSEERSGGESEMGRESLFDISLKKVSIRQVVRMAFHLENGGRPVKLRALSIDTQMDPAGYMNATLSVSAFMLKE